MKKYILLFIGFALALASCKDPNKTPVLTFEKATIGAYPRLVKLTTGEFDLKNISSTALKYEVEFVDKEKGTLVSEYVINAQYIGKNVSKDQIEYKRIPKSSFTDSEKGFKGVVMTIPLTDMLSAFGIDVSETAAGDNIAFSTTLVMDDGRTFSAGNSSPTVRGSAFKGYFTFNGKLTCPLEDTQFTGTYLLSYADPDNAKGGYGIPFVEGEVTVEVIPGSSTRRHFSAGYLPAFGPFGSDPSFDVVCDVVVWEEYNTGLGCGGGPIILGAGDPSPVDITNDNIIKLNIIDYKKDGGCGINPIPKTIILTKK